MDTPNVGANVTSLSVTGLSASTQYFFRVRATNGAGSSANSATASATTQAASTNAITAEYWNVSTGSGVASVPGDTTPTSTQSLTSFETPSNRADNYGARIRGFFVPVTTGSYTFRIAGDDNVRLSLNPSGTAESGKQVIASHTGWTNRREWNKYASQKSAQYTLTAGQRYYIEAIMRENGGGDNLAVSARVGSTTNPSNGSGTYIIPLSQMQSFSTTPAKLTGTAIGTAGSIDGSGNTIAKVFDNDLNSFFDAPIASGAWVGLDLGSAKTITSIKYAPRTSWASRMVGGTFQVSHTADFSTATTVLTVSTAPPESVLTTQTVSVAGTWRYVRYLAPNDGYGNIAEMEVFGF